MSVKGRGSPCSGPHGGIGGQSRGFVLADAGDGARAHHVAVVHIAQSRHRPRCYAGSPVAASIECSCRLAHERDLEADFFIRTFPRHTPLRCSSRSPYSTKRRDADASGERCHEGRLTVRRTALLPARPHPDSTLEHWRTPLHRSAHPQRRTLRRHSSLRLHRRAQWRRARPLPLSRLARGSTCRRSRRHRARLSPWRRRAASVLGSCLA